MVFITTLESKLRHTRISHSTVALVGTSGGAGHY